MIVGECFHLRSSFICSDRIHQNYPCPYRNNINKCPHSIVVTEAMVKQLKEKGYVQVPFSEIKYNPLHD